MRTLLFSSVVMVAACSSKKSDDAGEKTPPPAKPAPAPEPALEPAPAPTPTPTPAASLDAAPRAESASTDGQSFQDGLAKLCNSINEVPADLAPAEKQRAVSAYINEHVQNTEVRELFTLLGQMPPKQRPGMMAAAAAKAGLNGCPIAEQ